MVSLNCSDNQLTSLDVSKNELLESLYCAGNLFEELDIQNNNHLSAAYIRGEGVEEGTTIKYAYKNYILKYDIKVQIVVGTSVLVDASNFPDDNFRSFISSNYDKDKDGIIFGFEIRDIKEIDCSGKKIQNLKGIENFTALTKLDCCANQLTSLDVSKNTALKELSCGCIRLANLDVSGNTALTVLDCYDSKLTSLDVSKNTALTSLDCEFNYLTSLDLSKNTALTSLSCSGNQLTSLDVSQNTALTTLSCGGNPLTSLDVSQNTALTSLGCDNNQLTSLDISKNTVLQSLNCNGNQLTSLDLSKNTALTSLSCGGNQLTSLDLSKNTALRSLGCKGNQLTSLDVSNNTELNVLDCSENQLTSLDVNTALELIWCNNNQLTVLDVSNNTKLIEFYCFSYKLISLNISKDTYLYEFDCSENQLTSLDVSQNTNLSHLLCQNNQLTSLDVSKNMSLYELDCSKNQLTSLDVSINKHLSRLFCSNNQLTSLNVSKNAKLKSFLCDNNYLTSLDVSLNTMLKELKCHNNQLKKLDITNNENLIDVYKYGKRTVDGTIVSYESNVGILACDRKVQIVTGEALEPLKITLSSGANGVIISWKEEREAEKFRIYKKNAKGNWAKLAEVSTLNYTDTTVKVGETATYSVVGLSYAGKEINSIGDGTKITYKAPVITPTAKYKETGSALSWVKVNGAAKYRVFRKVGSGDWTNLTTTTSLSFVDKTAVYGKTYTYAVRAMDAKGSFISAMGSGTKFTYFAPTPKVTLKNGTTGINISWKTVSGAVKYRIFVKNTSGAWAKLATVKEGTTYTDTTAKVGKSYTYAVVGMDSAGRLMNDYGTGTTITREKPVMSFTLKSVAAGVKVSWKAADGAGKYRVYRKNSDGSWATLATIKDGSLFYRDKTAENGKTYTYAVVAMSAGGTALTDMGDGQSIKYVKPVSEAEVVEAEVTDADGNVIVYTISDDEITEDYITIVPEDQEEVEETEEGSEEDSKEKSEDEEVISEDTEETSEGTEEISEDAEETTREEEAVTEDTQESAENTDDGISEDTDEKISGDTDEESSGDTEDAFSEDNEEESGEEEIAEENISY